MRKIVPLILLVLLSLTLTSLADRTYPPLPDGCDRFCYVTDIEEVCSVRCVWEGIINPPPDLPPIASCHPACWTTSGHGEICRTVCLWWEYYPPRNPTSPISPIPYPLRPTLSRQAYLPLSLAPPDTQKKRPAQSLGGSLFR